MEDTKKTKLLLLARLRGLKSIEGLHPKNIKSVSRFVPEKKMTRRDILNLPNLIETRYTIVPYVLDSCSTQTECNLCVRSCRFNAITREAYGKKSDITKENCTGCGVCVNHCPSNAIVFPLTRAINTEIETILRGSRELVHKSRIISINCELIGEMNIRKSTSESTHLTVNVPCTGMVSMSQILRAFALGADGVLLNCTKCIGGVYPYLEKTVNFVHRLLEKSSIGGERIALNNLASGLMQRTDNIFFDGKSLDELILKFKEEFGINGVIEDAPFGFVHVDRGCTLCGLCVNVCPKHALKLKDDGNTIMLCFEHFLCTGCMLCSRVCPENVITVDEIIDPENQDAVLMRDEYAVCESCNKIIAPKSMYKKIWDKLKNVEGMTYLKYCSECRVLR